MQLRALGTYIHPPVTKDITNQVTWASNTPQMVTVNSSGLIIRDRGPVRGTPVSATVTTNHDGLAVSSSGAIVTGYMTADVVCFTGPSVGGSEPILTVSFRARDWDRSSSPAGFSCASTVASCVDSFPPGTTVTLTATPIGPRRSGAGPGLAQELHLHDPNWKRHHRDGDV